jgi:hypothetical protein
MIENFVKIFKEQNGRNPTEEEMGKAMKKVADLGSDRVRRALHGTSKNITAESKFKLLKNNGNRNKA